MCPLLPYHHCCLLQSVRQKLTYFHCFYSLHILVGIPEPKLRIIFKGCRVGGNAPLTDFGVKKNDVLDVILGMSGC